MLKKITTQHMGLNLSLDGLARVNYLVGVNGSGKTRVMQSIKMRMSLYEDNVLGKRLSETLPIKFYAVGGREFDVEIDGPIANHLFDLDRFMVQGEKRTPSPLGDAFAQHPMTQRLIQIFYPNLQFEVQMRGDNFISFRDRRNPNSDWLSLEKCSAGFQSLFKLWSVAWHDQAPNGSGLYLLGLDEGDRHLHPTLAKQLPSVLDELILNFEQVMRARSTNGQGARVQIFIATHSPFTVRGALEHNGHKIFHLKNGVLKHSFDHQEMIKISGLPFDNVLSDLGFQMQDLYYPATLICVEGPVDALYLQYWLEKFLEEKGEPIDTFVKGIHYDFFEFGGALAAHLTLRSNIDIDPEELMIPQNIVNVFSLNRRVFFMVDNDANDAFERTKKRLQKLFEKHHGCIFFRSNKYRTIECLLSTSTEISKDKNNKVSAAVVNLKAWRRQSTSLKEFNPEVYPLMEALYDFLLKADNPQLAH
jgi:predicted ATPase